jgi:acetyl-CoA decarbonylase/synthase complex subunit gamma
MSEDPEVIKAGLGASHSSKPLIHCATESNWNAMAKLAVEHKCPLAVKGEGIEHLAATAEKVRAAECNDIVLDASGATPAKTLENLTALRRLTIRKSHRPLGYPVMIALGGDDYGEAMAGALGIMKYASAIVFENAQPWKMLPLLTLRQNIFTDPQKPIQVKPGLYEIGKPVPESPLYFTTNFSLTYFTVKGDIEKSKVASFLLVVEAEGLSVLTAYAAGKLTAEGVLAHLQEFGVKSKINHNKLIIPGMVARMSVKLKELTGMEVVVGPNDSSGIPSFVKTMK